MTTNKENKVKVKKISPTSKEAKRKKACRFCGSHRGVITKYNLYICRRCFNDYANELGFKKYD